MTLEWTHIAPRRSRARPWLELVAFLIPLALLAVFLVVYWFASRPGAEWGWLGYLALFLVAAAVLALAGLALGIAAIVLAQRGRERVLFAVAVTVLNGVALAILAIPVVGAIVAANRPG